MRTTALLCLFFVCTSSAQESRSHRKLQIPERGGSAVPDRFLKLREMMQQKRQQQQRPDEGGFSDNEMSFLKNMADFFQQSGVMPDPSMIPPELVDRIRKDPRAQQQAKEMLERFAKEGKLPDAGQAQQMLKDFQDSQSGQRPLTLPGATPDQQATRPSEEKDVPSQPRSNGQRDASNSNQRLLNPPGSSDSDLQKNSPETSSDFLDRLIQQQRQNGETEPLTPEELAEALPGFRPSAGSENDGSSSQPPAIRPGQKDRSIPDAMDPQQSIDQFLEQLKDMDLPQTAPGTNADDTKLSNDAARSTVEEARQRAEQQQREKREAAKQRVRDKGLSGTLKDMLKEAKEEAGEMFVQEQREQRQGQTSQPAKPSTGGVSQGMMNLLDGMKDDIVELARDLKEDRRGQRRNRPSRPPRNQRPDRESAFRPGPQAANQDRGPGFFERITESLSPDTGSNSDSSSESSVLPEDLANFEQPQPVIANHWIMTAAVLLIVFLAGVLLAGRYTAKPIALAQKIQHALVGRQPTEIKSRQDVVAAFHEVALSPDHMVQQWWTHQQAGNEIARDKPQKAQSVQTLASVYEQARYLPDSAEFSEQSLQRARDAVAEVRS